MKYIALIIALFIIIYLFVIPQKPPVSSILVNNTKFEIEIADNDVKRGKGLSGREFLDEKHGMLFIFPVKDYYNFWMNEMKIPLDFIWIDGNKVVDLTENVPPPKNKSDLKLFTSGKPADKVLEIAAGSISRNKIKNGDTVQITKI